MLKRLVAAAILATTSTTTFAQTAFIQDGAELPGGGTYDGTIDTEFRAANPTTEQGSNPEISIDDFDGGFQTQAAIRFEDLLVSDGGFIPQQVADGTFDLVFAELRLWVTSPTASDAIINFNRVIAPDTTSGEFWQEDDTWASLGGDLIPDEGGFLDGDPIAEDGTEAAASPDFTVPLPADDPLYNTSTDSEDVLRALLAAETPQADAIEQSFFRFDVTDAISDWVIDGEPNYGWSINNNTGNGWDFVSSDASLDNAMGFEQAGVEFDGVNGPDVAELRPVLTVIYASPGGRGDLDFDGDVDLDDYQLLLDNLAIELDGAIPTGATGDLDFDRDVDLDDFGIFKNEYDLVNGAGAFALALSVPEPSTALLITLCGLVGGFTRRR
ncbi:hypothetical protein MalM25_07790 [Planctomycetes bacterium MalM25]|nr:hypothetical protein MalM25_07790 [Planctomycetes bacterium MalM25]